MFEYKEMKRTGEISCSKCGRRKTVSLNPDTKNSVLKVAHRWTTTGYVLYCPECSKIIRSFTDDYETVLGAILGWLIR